MRYDLGRRPTLETIRNLITGAVPGTLKLNADADADQVLSYGIYWFIRSHVDALASVDGWGMFQCLEETDSVLRAVGLMYILPSSKPPLEGAFYREPDGLHYDFWFGIEDAQWKAHSESKRWKLMYCYANLGHDAAWTWDEPIRGVVDLARI